MPGIEGDSSINPQMRQEYQKECTRGLTLFQQTLQAYEQSHLDAQKEQYKEVMGKALQVIRETAAQCLSQEMQKKELRLENDYQAFINNPSPEHLKQLNQDVQQLIDKIDKN